MSFRQSKTSETQSTQCTDLQIPQRQHFEMSVTRILFNFSSQCIQSLHPFLSQL